MPWYSYKLGGWQIAVDAINRQDAAQHIKRAAPGAEYQSEFNPPHMVNTWSMATAMVTERRDAEIRANCAKFRGE
jgi:hypothetical protein